MNSSPTDESDEGWRGAGAGALRDAIVASVIAQLAPEELPSVEALRELDDETALKRLIARPVRGEPLGFGVEEVGLLLTPALWIVVDESVRRVVGAVVERAGQSRFLRRFPFRRRREPVPVSVPALTPEQLASIERCVREAAQQARLSQDRGERIADGVVRRLALMQSAIEEPEATAEGSG
ncbi:MAG: hypothetical protein HOY79_38335 [Streptomyces sp.]|nr:hypothetical protein [Streptomyces sp.]